MKSEVDICRSSQSSKFIKASTYLSAVVAKLYTYVNLHQAASESTVFMLLAVETVSVEELNVLVAEVEAEDKEE